MIANVLSIAGTDPSGGAGLHADLKTFSALGSYGMAAVTAVVAQNTRGVKSFVALEPQFVADQIDAVFEDINVNAVKIGMIANIKIGEAIMDRLNYHKAKNIVLDPVMVSKSGDLLMNSDAVDFIREVMVPKAAIITPNLLEGGVLLSIKPDWSVEKMQEVAPALMELGAGAVLLKGGALKGAKASDLLCLGNETIWLEKNRVETKNDHGTGCTISAAIAALLPTYSLKDAVFTAKDYLTQALIMSTRLTVGKGHGPVHHFHNIWSE